MPTAEAPAADEGALRRMVSLECRAAGTAAVADAAALRELLQGLSGYAPARVYQHELVLKGPGQDRQAAELRLTHHLPLPLTEPAELWQRDRTVGCGSALVCSGWLNVLLSFGLGPSNVGLGSMQFRVHTHALPNGTQHVYG